MGKYKTNKIPFNKRKENLCGSLCEVERFLRDLNKSLKYISIFKHLK